MVQEDRLTDDLVRRMHVSLASALRRSRPNPFGKPVTVAEIYQDLIPYRAVRSRLGLEMNADYEHTLLRLLAGESGLARLEPREARIELETEIASANPNVGLFRKFAACDVWIAATDEVDAQDSSWPATHAPIRPPITRPAPGPVDDLPLLAEDLAEELVELDWTEAPAAQSQETKRSAEADRPAEPTGHAGADTWDAALAAAAARARAADAGTAGVFEPVAEPAEQGPPEAGNPVEEEIDLEPFDAELLLEDEVVDAAAVEGGIVEGTPEPAPEPLERSMREPSAVRPSAKGEGTCAFCDTALPGRRAVKFCPFCGADQSMRPCGSCGEPLEEGWRFCIACGTTAPAAMVAAT